MIKWNDMLVAALAGSTAASLLAVKEGAKRKELADHQCSETSDLHAFDASKEMETRMGAIATLAQAHIERPASRSDSGWGILGF